MSNTEMQSVLCVAAIEAPPAHAVRNALTLTTGETKRFGLRECGNLAVFSEDESEEGWGSDDEVTVLLCSQSASGKGLRELELLRSTLRDGKGQRMFALLPALVNAPPSEPFIRPPWLLSEILHCASPRTRLWTEESRRSFIDGLADRTEFKAVLAGVVHEIGHFLDFQSEHAVPTRIRERQQHWLRWRNGLADAWYGYAETINGDLLPQLELFVADGPDAERLKTLVTDLYAVCQALRGLDEAVRIRSRRLAQQGLNRTLDAIGSVVNNDLFSSATRNQLARLLTHWRN